MNFLVTIMVLAFVPGLAWSQAEAPAPSQTRARAGSATPDRPVGGEIRVSRDEAILLALENNLDLIIARTGPQIAQQDLERALGAYDPDLFLEHQFEETENPVLSRFQDILGVATTQVKDKDWTYSAGFSGLVASGITYSSSYNLRRAETDSGISSLDPEWRADWGSELRIPILRDLFSNQASITVERSQIGVDISIEDFRQELMDQITTVENAYWELGGARADERVTQKSLETAGDLLEQTQVQYEVGVVSRVAVSQAEAGVAEREVAAIVASNRADGAQDALLNLIAVPSMQEYATTQLVTADPTFVDYSVDPSVAIERAMRLRPEIRTARKRVEDNEFQLQLAGNQLLPRLDLIASYRLSGLSGEPVDPVTGGIPPAPIFPTSRSGANDDFFSSNPRSWGARGPTRSGSSCT